MYCIEFGYCGGRLFFFNLNLKAQSKKLSEKAITKNWCSLAPAAPLWFPIRLSKISVRM